jgi:competence protein ComFC
MLKKLLNFIFPRKCISCRKDDFWICDVCQNELFLINKASSDFAYSVFDYRKKKVRQIVKMIKFQNKFSVLDDLEEVLQKEFMCFLEKENLSDKDLFLIPIPITKRSKAKRKYNQSKLVSRKISKNFSKIKILDDVLYKTKNHLPQNQIRSRFERTQNIKNSFGLKNEEKIKGKIIILVDDVLTTGATLSEARKVLNKSGVKKVFAFTLAH